MIRGWVAKRTEYVVSLSTGTPITSVVRREGRLYVINKLNPRFKTRQG